MFRYNTVTNSAIGSHGVDTSAIGGRYFEAYNNNFIWNTSDLCGPGVPANVTTFMSLRGGTALMHDNVVPHITSSAWGSKTEIFFTVEELRRNAGPYPCWGTATVPDGYPAPRQPGWGFISGATQAGSTGVFQDLEPIYLWNNTGTGNYTNPAIQEFASNQCGAGAPTVVDYIKSGREYFISTAKPGYTPYTYPHPLVSGSTTPPPPPADTTPPSTPTGLTATAVSTSQINLSWSASSDNVGVTGYRVYRNSIQIATPTGTSYSDTGLASATTYSYTVKAYDAAGNVSVLSAAVSAATQSITPPPPPPSSGSINDSSFLYTGTWNAAPNSLAYLGDEHYTDVFGASFQISFTGTQIKLYATIDVHHGIGSVSIDGGAASDVDFYSATRVVQTPVYTSPLLANTTHTLTMTVTGRKNPASTGFVIVADRADVSASSPPPASTKFNINDRVQVENGTLNVRATPTTAGTLLGSQPVGALGTVVGGPTLADGFNWWKVNYDTGADGWSVEDNLTMAVVSPAPIPPPAPTPAPPPPPTGNGDLQIKRVGLDLTTSTAPTNTRSAVDQLPSTTANPASFAALTAAGHTIYMTDASSSTERAGTCTYAIGASECSVSTFPLTPFCNGIFCSVPVNIISGQVTKVVVQYQ